MFLVIIISIMKIIIAGIGTVGFQIASQLIFEGNDVVLIEKDEVIAKELLNRLDCIVINGNVQKLDVLREAGLENASYFLCLTESDEINLLSCSIVSKFYPKVYKVARVKSLEYILLQEQKPSPFEVDYIVNPSFEIVDTILKTMEYGAVSDIFSLEEGDICISSLVIDQYILDSVKSVEEFGKSLDIKFLIVLLINSKNEVIVPNGQTQLEEGDIIYICAKEKGIHDIFEHFNKNINRIKDVFILGGGVICQGILDRLNLKKNDEGKGKKRSFLHYFLTGIQKVVKRYSKDRKIVIVEKDYEVCKFLSENYRDILVINDSITKDTVFEENELGKCDLIIASTKNQELNIVSALYAKKIGIKKAITIVENKSYEKMAKELGIDVPISYRNSISLSLTGLIKTGNIINVQSIADGQVEIIKTKLQERSKFINKEIRNLNLPKNTIIISISRGDETLIPDGSIELLEGDTISLLALKDFKKEVDKYLSLI